MSNETLFTCIFSQRWPTLAEPIGNKRGKKILEHNTDFKRQMILAEVGDVIFGLVLFLQDSYS